MMLMCSMCAVEAVSDYPNISPFPVRFDMLDGSCSLHPQPKPQKPSCRDKKPFRGRCVKCPGMVDESRRFSGWIPLCWWVLLSCFGCVVLFAGRWESLESIAERPWERESDNAGATSPTWGITENGLYFWKLPSKHQDQSRKSIFVWLLNVPQLMYQNQDPEKSISFFE